MARTPLFLAAAILLSAVAGQASAAQCRDAAGKFTACPAAPAAKTQCRDASGKFIKCSNSAKPAGTTTAAATTKPAAKATTTAPKK
jgi:hypothetical protein